MGLQSVARPTIGQVVALFEGEAAAHLKQATAELRNFGRRFNLLLPLGADDGRRYVQIKGARRTDTLGKPVADAVWFTDVTELIEAGKAFAAALDTAADGEDRANPEAEAARLEAAGWRAVLEDLDAALCVFDAERRLVLATPAFEDLFRLDPEAVASNPTQDRLLDTLRTARQLPEVPNFAEFKAREAARFETQEEWREKLLTLPDGRMVRARVGPHPAGGLVYAFADVTEQFGSERRARLADSLRETALANLPEAVLVATAEGRVGLANPGFARLFGVSSAFLETRPRLEDLIESMKPAIDDAEVPWAETAATWRRALAVRKRAEGAFDTATGQTLAYTIAPLPDGGTLAAFVDVTAQARVEQALRDRAEAEADAGRAKTRFIADVSFELRNPLNAITGYAELLRGGYHGDLNARQTTYANAIRDQAEALSAVVADIVELSAIEAGTVEPEMGPVDVHALLAGLVTMAEARARAKALHVVFDVDPDIGWIRGDEARLRHALAHVLSNAIRFTPERGAVRISAGRDGEWVAIAVSDDGIGVPKAERQRVFDPFQHAANAPPAQRGPGLGLALVKRCAVLHGGSAEISANAKRGATVTVRLPADRGAPADAFAPDNPA